LIRSRKEAWKQRRLVVRDKGLGRQARVIEVGQRFEEAVGDVLKLGGLYLLGPQT
jgi:hypothetical protein